MVGRFERGRGPIVVKRDARFVRLDVIRGADWGADRHKPPTSSHEPPEGQEGFAGTQLGALDGRVMDRQGGCETVDTMVMSRPQADDCSATI